MVSLNLRQSNANFIYSLIILHFNFNVNTSPINQKYPAVFIVFIVIIVDLSQLTKAIATQANGTIIKIN